MGKQHQSYQEKDMSVVNEMTISSIQENQKNKICTTFIWLKSNVNDTAQKAILKTLETMQGISEVKYVRQTPCIMMVYYCHRQVKCKALISAINLHGGVARIIGC